jgi:hypothetical protein
MYEQVSIHLPEPMPTGHFCKKLGFTAELLRNIQELNGTKLAAQSSSKFISNAMC